MSKTSKKELLRRLEKVEKWIGEQTEVSVSGEKDFIQQQHFMQKEADVFAERKLMFGKNNNSSQFLDEVLESELNAERKIMFGDKKISPAEDFIDRVASDAKKIGLNFNAHPLETPLEKAVFECSENGLVPGFYADRDLVIFCVGENANGYSGFTLTPNPNYQIGEFRETWSKKAFDRITPEEASKKIRYEFLKPEEKP